MAFIGNVKRGTMYEPGYFIANGDENIIRETRQIHQSSTDTKTTEDGGKYVPMGSIFPANDSTAEGIVYEDVDVTSGDMPGSVVTGNCTVYTSRLAVESLDSAAKSALEAKGFKFIASVPVVTRPY